MHLPLSDFSVSTLCSIQANMYYKKTIMTCKKHVFDKSRLSFTLRLSLKQVKLEIVITRFIRKQRTFIFAKIFIKLVVYYSSKIYDYTSNNCLLSPYSYLFYVCPAFSLIPTETCRQT